MIALTAQTEPDANIPSKNVLAIMFVSKQYLVGENNTKLIKNPTHVDVHIIHFSNPDKNSPND